jgi:exopolyphosphatase/guanosine-5'-triphosphate,3'-diphosphate pyrophosphatase
MRVATVDVGTNSILLLVVEMGGDLGAPRVLADRCRIERLGRGVDRAGALDEAAIARALDAMREYGAAIRELGAERVAAVGTQALREAKNGAEFLEPARELLGAPIEVIVGEREAELAFLAVTRSFPELAGDVVVCDVGGGSTELVVGNGGRAGRIASMASVAIGSVRMTERHLHGDPPTAAEAKAMIADIDASLAAVELPSGVPLVGIAGTVTTLAAVALGLEPYDPDRVQGMRLPRGEVERQLARYLELPLELRRRIRGLEPKRADVIPAGAAVVGRVMARTGASDIIVSDRGIRWGLAYELADEPTS